MSRSLSEKRTQTLIRGLAWADRCLEQGAHRSLLISRGRLMIFITAFVVCLALYKSELFHAGNVALLFFLLLFFAVAQYHSRLEDRLHRVRVWKTVKHRNLARLRLDWDGIPYRSVPSPSSHPYAADLDLHGRHSLLGLIDTTLSSQGTDRLVCWLLNQNAATFSLDDCTRRQQLVKELSPLSLLRDRLVLEATLIDETPIQGDRIQELIRTSVDVPALVPLLVLSGVLALVNITLVALSVVTGLPEYWVVSLTLYALLYFSLAGRIAPIFGRVLALQQELHKFGALVRLLERRSFTGKPMLSHLCQPLITSAYRPSKAIKRLARVCHGLSVKAHPLVHLALNAILPWDLWLAYRLRSLCHRLHTALPIWLDCFATLDAAASLGGFAYVNPRFAWPELQRHQDEALSSGFTGTELGHPLINEEKRVTNDFAIHGLGNIVLVTGSNMSGKSTFLRTIGVNLCLAQAGAPVCANTFEWTWMRLFCCIRVSDSLDEGLSYFYAEVKRLRQVMESTSECEGAPVLFLIDEIFKGTNNRERLIGSEAYIRTLTKGRGLGLISTHDLELAQLEQELPQVRNVHFQETVAGKELQFDFHLRPGPCPTTNALRIMAKEGLPVPEMGSQSGRVIKE